MGKKAVVDYDKENDIVYFYTGESVKDSLSFDQFVFDFSHEGKIVALEVMNASELLKRLGIAISRAALGKIREADFAIIQQREFLYVKISFFVKIRGKTVQRQILAPAPITKAMRAR